MSNGNNLSQENNGIKPNRGLKIAHFNSRSILPKLASINIWLNEYKFDIVTINETWLAPDTPTSLLDIDDYEIVRQDRATGKKGGGLLTLIRKR